MKYHVYFFVLCLLGMNVLHAQQFEQKHYEGIYQEEVKLNYIISYPKKYDTKKKYPLLVFLHGAGERGDSLPSVGIHGPLKYIRSGKNIDAIVLAPQCPKEKYWGDKNVNIMPLIQEIVKTQAVDTNRIYLTGLSMGGYGTWDLALKNPKTFAALAPVCGPIFRTFPRNACMLSHIPIWVFHGAMDGVVDIRESSDMVKALLQCGGQKPLYTVYPFAEHDSWTATYDNPDFYTWLLEQKK